ncbi:amidohydrolase family protein [Patescibacteria group bacterium]|nr:amidohydrolase family protein [Patescibacteria group bacterium]
MNIKSITNLSAVEKKEIEYLASWLLDTIIDFHVHCHGIFRNYRMVNEKAKTVSEMVNFFEYENHVEIFSSVFSGISWQWSMMGLPFAADEEENNSAMLRISKIDRRVIPIYTMTRNIDEARLKSAFSKGFAGLKMYPSNEQKIGKTRIDDVFPEKIIRIVDKFQSFLVLHLPKNLIQHIDELTALAKKYKKATFLVAHMGNHQEKEDGVAEAFFAISSYRNIYLDTSFNASSEIISLALRLIGPDRIVFGSDAPLAFLRGKWEKSLIYNSIRIKGREKWSWLDPKEFESYMNVRISGCYTLNVLRLQGIQSFLWALKILLNKK